MVDGAARGNPGPAGCGAVILDENGVVVKDLSCYLGRATNNAAEYEGLLMGSFDSAKKYRRAKRFPALGAPVKRGSIGSRRQSSKRYFSAP
jgi:hypothetical protein